MPISNRGKVIGTPQLEAKRAEILNRRASSEPRPHEVKPQEKTLKNTLNDAIQARRKFIQETPNRPTGLEEDYD
jgi:hypothetical protein